MAQNRESQRAKWENRSPDVYEIAEALIYREREALNLKRFMHSSFIESQNPESLTLIS